MKKVGVALLGLGVVGGGAYEILKKHRDFFKKTQDIDIVIKYVMDKNTARCAELGVDPSIVTTDIDVIANDPDVQIVAEFFGGIEPARSFLIKVLKNGKSIVTANKELFSKYWHELEAAAKEGKAGLYYEASCVGGVPIIRTLTEGMQANRILSIKGIINGTTNYILSSMSNAGKTYEAALSEAQRLGYAEADPTADVEGFDAMYKLSILSSLAYHKKVPIDRIYREGISQVAIEDILIGKELGFTLKLLAISKDDGRKIQARVHPTFVPDAHPLASVSGSFNAVHLVGDSVGDIMLYGRGAGALPTGSAIVSDILYAAGKSKHRYCPFPNTDAATEDSDFADDFFSKYYVRLTVKDEVGTLGRIAGAYGKNNVSIVTVLQRDSRTDTVPIIFVTHGTYEKNIKKAIEDIKSLKGVNEVNSVIRVEE
ncbi:MAG: homoserine dehydrogenase [Clostridiales bacterium]|jgi:homoserine dehydrogenase|nr:homoserine dehydrogenase [Clostridiales bacterium]